MVSVSSNVPWESFQHVTIDPTIVKTTWFCAFAMQYSRHLFCIETETVQNRNKLAIFKALHGVYASLGYLLHAEKHPRQKEQISVEVFILEFILEETGKVLLAGKSFWLKIFVNVLQKDMTLCYFSSSLYRWASSFHFQQEKSLCICKTPIWWWLWTST